MLLSCHGDTVKAVRIPEDAWAVHIAKQVTATVGIDAKAVFITGFTDASIYDNHGIEMAVIGIGAQDEHSTTEHIAVADMEKAVQALVEMLRLAAAEPRADLCESPAAKGVRDRFAYAG